MRTTESGKSIKNEVEAFIRSNPEIALSELGKHLKSAIRGFDRVTVVREPEAGLVFVTFMDTDGHVQVASVDRTYTGGRTEVASAS